MLKMQLERHYPLQIQSVQGQATKLAVRRAELGPDPDFYPNNSFLPKVQRMLESELPGNNGNNGVRMDVSGLNRPIRPKSAATNRNRLLPNNPFYFTLPDEPTSLTPRGRKRDTHLKSFGPSTPNIALLKTPNPPLNGQMMMMSSRALGGTSLNSGY